MIFGKEKTIEPGADLELRLPLAYSANVEDQLSYLLYRRTAIEEIIMCRLLEELIMH